MPFNIPPEVDNFLSLQIVLLCLVGFLYNIGTNGQATLLHLEQDYGITPDSKIVNPLDNCSFLNKFSQQTLWRVKEAKYLSYFLYCLVSPAISYYYAFFVFSKMKKDKPSFLMELKKYSVNFKSKLSDYPQD